jgi:hypothetical protein
MNKKDLAKLAIIEAEEWTSVRAHQCCGWLLSAARTRSAVMEEILRFAAQVPLTTRTDELHPAEMAPQKKIHEEKYSLIKTYQPSQESALLYWQWLTTAAETDSLLATAMYKCLMRVQLLVEAHIPQGDNPQKCQINLPRKDPTAARVTRATHT